MQIGLGFDLHRIKPCRAGSIVVAGVRIPAPYRIIAHSDGDFVFHAAADAVYSALGLTDIGDKFPAGLAKTRKMNSRLILESAMRELKKRKRRLLNLSVVIAAERPKLGPYRQAMRHSLAETTRLPPGKIGITLKTFENLAPLAEKAVACWANCLIK
ncbi:MAG: 2-C-methyl-D-erythritol 2,4-cyclodiphosphate synthase [Elusimicrobia bacterium]|nr:2-C-methyl-D-erythritol 2,4-cyclodiphosphate synthase [Elusimicrobiota bacterium]